jgi:hypothetical protein
MNGILDIIDHYVLVFTVFENAQWHEISIFNSKRDRTGLNKCDNDMSA